MPRQATKVDTGRPFLHSFYVEPIEDGQQGQTMKPDASSFDEKAIKVIDAHIPSMSSSDREKVERDRYDLAIDGIDLLRRTCACGLHIYGMSMYISHLKEMLEKERDQR